MHKPEKTLIRFMRGLLVLLVFAALLLFGGLGTGTARAWGGPPPQAVQTSAPAIATPDAGDPGDLAGLEAYAKEIQQLLTANVDGIPLAPLVLVWTLAATFVGLAKTKDDKRRWAVGWGLAFGLCSALQEAPAIVAATPAVFTLLLVGGIIRGLTAGIVAALLYETGGALLNKKAAA